jgi:predicted metal-dependent phosphoesterase TrpH
MFADLHLHTRYSDGTYTPRELVEQAVRQNLVAIALTDHDTVEGCAETATACREAGIEFFPATELTAELDGHELHLLAYGIDPLDPPLLAAMRQFQTARQDRIREMVRRLNQLGIPLNSREVLNLAGCHSPGRPHVARALVGARVCSSPDEAFERFLKRGRPAWASKFKIAAPDAIALIHAAGGLAVMAHPGLNRIDSLLPDLAAAQLDGLECFHSKHSPASAQHYLDLAKKLGLLATGGSDCHGLAKGTPLIGSVRLPYAYVERLKDRFSERARAAHQQRLPARSPAPCPSDPEPHAA